MTFCHPHIPCPYNPVKGSKCIYREVLASLVVLHLILSSSSVLRRKKEERRKNEGRTEEEGTSLHGGKLFLRIEKQLGDAVVEELLRLDGQGYGTRLFIIDKGGSAVLQRPIRRTKSVKHSRRCEKKATDGGCPSVHVCMIFCCCNG